MSVQKVNMQLVNLLRPFFVSWAAMIEEFLSNRKRAVVSHEFFNNASSHDFTIATVLAGTTQVPSSGIEANHPGVVRLRSGSGGDSGVRVNTEATIILSAGATFELICKLETLSGTTFRIGFHDTLTVADATDGVYFEMTSSTLVGKTATASTRSTTATSYGLSTSIWYRFVIHVESQDLVRFMVYGSAGSNSLLWSDSLTTNIPVASGQQCGVACVFTHTGGIVDMVLMDYLQAGWRQGLVR